ncbi:MAG: TlyA family rRNA (cytidine-2'-O)-methyltransferase [Candidatus Melainabacteria bacterium]|nr:MAG: TlyA family rRNA (cytidine-2'-O)-methyltransferase [Candidatus Melainabacteria bacterium]
MAKSGNIERLDTIVVERGLFATKESARTAIMEGLVLVDGQPVTKPGHSVKAQSKVELSPSYQPPKFVSRGGLKLEKALDEFLIDLSNRICLDIGASTGGFTDCMLKRGARYVYAVDVGYGQLDWTLRQDARVKVMERVNARNLTPSMLYSESESAARADFASMDVSFISAFKVLPSVLQSMDENKSEFVVLVKPQFEAGRQFVGHGGVVRDPAVHLDVLNMAREKSTELGLHPQSVSYSPIKGPKGNIEFLLHLSREKTAADVDLAAVVQRAHSELTIL